KWARRRPAIAALVGAVLLAVLGGSVGALFYGLYKDQQAAASKRDREQLQNRLERRQKIDEACNAGQSHEDAGRFALAKEHWDQALGILNAEPDPSLEYLRGGIEDHRRRVQKHLDAEATRHQVLDGLGRFRKHADDVLTREISITERDRAED